MSKSTPPAQRIPKHYASDAALARIKIIQTTMQAIHAINKVAQARNIDFSAASCRHNSADIAGFPESIANSLRALHLTSALLPHFQRHIVYEPVNFSKIMETGALWSMQKLKLYGHDIRGLMDKADELNNADRFVFAMAGTRPDEFAVPKAMVNKRLHYFLFDIRRWHASNPSIAHYHIFKGRDWGEPTDGVITIPGTQITIRRPYRNIGLFSKDAKQRYGYRNNDTKTQLEYELKLLDEVAAGDNYHRLIPNLIAQHLRMLPEAEQQHFLSPLIQATNEDAVHKAATELI